MTPDEARAKILGTNERDVEILRNILAAYQHDTGIGWPLFCEQLGLVTQEFRLMTKLLGPVGGIIEITKLHHEGREKD